MTDNPNYRSLADALFRANQPAPQPFLLRKAKPRVFVSFDFENDRHFKRLLEAWSANKRFQFVFQDMTPQEIQTSSVARVKGVLTTKVQTATHVLVLCGRHVNQRHPDSALIGCTNWIHFECQQAVAYKKKIVAVGLYPGMNVPSNIAQEKGIWVSSFNEAEIVKALSQ